MVAFSAHLATHTELRELREEVRKLKSDGGKPAVQFEEPGDDTKPDDDRNMDVDEEADSREKLEMRMKEKTGICVKWTAARAWMRASRIIRRRCGGRSWHGLSKGDTKYCWNTYVRRCYPRNLRGLRPSWRSAEHVHVVPKKRTCYDNCREAAGEGGPGSNASQSTNGCCLVPAS